MNDPTNRRPPPPALPDVESVHIAVDGVVLEGEFAVPAEARGLVLFAHGTGSSHRSPRNRCVATQLQRAGLGTLLFDLLSLAEEANDLPSCGLHCDIDLLTRRLVLATDWARRQAAARRLGFGYFGGSTGAAAALRAAVQRPRDIQAIVCRGGRTDLAGDAVSAVLAPTLLIVGGWDDVVLQANHEVLKHLPGVKRLEVIPGATHLFEEPGAMERAAQAATAWFLKHLRERPEPDAA